MKPQVSRQCGPGKKKEQTNRSMNKIKSPTLDPINTRNWSLVKEQRQHNETKAVSSNKWHWNNWTTTHERMNLNTHLTPFKKN